MMVTSMCDPNQVTRRLFSAEGLRLTVPSYTEDAAIRWLIERGRSIETAYMEANASSITPEPALRPCAREVLEDKYYDLEAGEMKRSSRGYTCFGFWECYKEYISGNRRFPGRTAHNRRMQIATGLFAPSYNEDRCIRAHFHQYKDLEAAYLACNAEGILPDWQSCIAFVSKALTNMPSGDIYTALRTWYRLQYLSGWPPSPGQRNGNGTPIHYPAHHEPTQRPPSRKNLAILAAAIVGLALISRR